MRIEQDFIPKGRNNRPARKNPKLFITIHETDNVKVGADADNHVKYLKGDIANNKPVSWHFTVDEKKVKQHLPVDEDAYHAGDGKGTGNRKTIGIEMCVNQDGNFLKTLENTIWLVKKLMEENNIPIENVVQHNKWSGKNCPRNLRAGKFMNWTTFIDKIKEKPKSENEVEKAIDKLYHLEIINSPKYWKEKVKGDGSLKMLFIKVANYLG